MSILTSLTTSLTTKITSGVLSAADGIDSVVPNPISTLDNIISDVDLSDLSAYTFSSGVIIDSVAANSGIGLTNFGAPEYDATLFDGKGGAKATNLAQALIQDGTFTATATQTVFLVLSLPSYTSNNTIFSYANNGGNGNSNARILHNAVGGMSYGRKNEAAGFETILTGGSDNVPYVVCLRYNSASSLDYFINSTTASGNFDPDDNATTLNSIRLGSRTATDGDNGIQFGYFLQTSDAMTDTEVADTMTYLASEYGATL